MAVDMAEQDLLQNDVKMDTTDFSVDSKISVMRSSILDNVAHGNGFFKSQQIGEKDLTFEEKRHIANNLLERNIVIFLQRYWKFIDIKDISYFNSYRDDYEVNFYLSEICKFHDSKKSKVKIKNRRYEALQRLIHEGTYFSDKEMKERNPMLYEQLIGQYLTEKERAEFYNSEEKCNSFSGFLMNCIEKTHNNAFLRKQQDEEDGAYQEEDDDSSDEEEYYTDVKDKVSVTVEGKQMLRAEFTNIMYESFLSGKDENFDYSSVDDNVEYDSVHLRGLDEEEKYFDADSSDEFD